jgi:hypothetical protein
MRSLYKALGLTSISASEDEIRAAIDRCTNVEIARRARVVLLDAQRRRLYCSTLSQLQHIAHLRANLGLAQAESWTRVVPAGELNVAPDRAPSRFESLKARLALAAAAKSQAPTEGKSTKGACGCLLWIGVPIVLLLLADSCSKRKPSTSNYDPSYSSAPATPQIAATPRTPPRIEFDAPALVMPSTGQISGLANSVAPLEITPKDSAHAYYVKLVRPNTRNAIAEYFIRPGQRLKAEAPLGNYELRYAAGTTWYGEKYLFGPETSYSEALSILDFRETPTGYTGYTIELFLQVNGNLRTQSLDPDEF